MRCEEVLNTYERLKHGASRIRRLKLTFQLLNSVGYSHVSKKWVGEWRLVGQVCTTLHLHAPYILTAPAHLLFPSLPGPVVGEMLSAPRFAAVGMVGRPLTHVVRDAFCEGDEGIAEVPEQHRYPPTASAVRECDGNVAGVQVVSLEIMQIVTSTIRAIYLPCVQCKTDTA